MVAYIFLLAAIIAEVCGTSMLKLTEGFTRLWPSVACLFAYAAAFVLIAQALERGVPVGMAYAIWAGLGVSLIAVIGMIFLGDPFSYTKVAAIALIATGVVILNLAGAHS